MSMREALRKLTMMARTSGGVSGPDPALMAACEEAEAALSAPDETAELREALRHCLAFIKSCADMAYDGKVVDGDGGVYDPEFTDIELVPDGSYKMSHADAALSRAKP